jgi:ribosomal protein S18 acetylase RimI-like enzyme
MRNEELSILIADLNNPTYCKFVVELINEYRCDPMGGEIGKLSSESEQALIEGLRIHPSSIVYFITSNDAIAGMAVCFIGFSTFKARRLLNIHDFILYKKFRKQGIGTWFLQKISEDISKQNYCRLTLEVRTDNYIAKKVYTKSGFASCENPMEFWVRDL